MYILIGNLVLVGVCEVHCVCFLNKFMAAKYDAEQFDDNVDFQTIQT